MCTNIIYGYARMEDPALLVIAKRIFGEDLVQKAYVVSGVYLRDDEYEYHTTITKLTKSLLGVDDIDKECINYDHYCIQLVFNNGHCVEFGTSEWGSISQAKDLDITLTVS